MKTFKIIYYLPKPINGVLTSVAFMNGVSRQDAIHKFQETYRGQYSTIRLCEEI
jgi:hypothetical protein